MTEWLSACNCILAGGETAEMPGIVPDGMVELSGFAIGAVEKPDLLDPSRVEPGDAVIGYPSDGFHANGWSLVRRVLANTPPTSPRRKSWPCSPRPGSIMRKSNALKAAGIDIKAMAHITGGGLAENLERFLGNKGADLTIPGGILARSPKSSHVDAAEAVNTFNMGWGWVVIVPAAQKDAALACGLKGNLLGTITADHGVKVKVG